MNYNAVEILNILLKKNYDSLKDYKTVADTINCSKLHQFFNRKVMSLMLSGASSNRGFRFRGVGPGAYNPEDGRDTTNFGFPVRDPSLADGERWLIKDISLGSSSWRKDNLKFNLAIGYPF